MNSPIVFYRIKAIQQQLDKIDLQKSEAGAAESFRFFMLPKTIQNRIGELMEQLVTHRGCCEFQESMDIGLRRQIAQKYHVLKEELLGLGMPEDDSILLRIRKQHLCFQQHLLGADFVSLELDLAHMFKNEVCPEEAGTSGDGNKSAK